MASSLHQKCNGPGDQRGVCAICRVVSPIKEDNLLRRRHLHDMVRVLEESHSSGMQNFPASEDNSDSQNIRSQFGLIEEELKTRRLISLCDRCYVEVSNALRNNEEVRRFRASTGTQRRHLNYDMGTLEGLLDTSSKQFTTLATATNFEGGPTKSHPNPSVEAGLAFFRNILAEQAKKLNDQRTQMHQARLLMGNTPGPNLTNAILPTLTADAFPVSGPTLHSPAPTGHRKRAAAAATGSSEMDVEPSIIPKRLKLRKTLPDFTRGILAKAKVGTYFWSQDSISDRDDFHYDETRKKLFFGDVEVKINPQDRTLECGRCSMSFSQPESVPGGVYKVSYYTKRHIISHLKDKKKKSTVTNAERSLEAETLDDDAMDQDDVKNPSDFYAEDEWNSTDVNGAGAVDEEME